MPIDESLISLVGEIEEDVTDLAKKVALTVHRSVVLGCPVDTGRARGSVHVSVGYKSGTDPVKPDKSGSNTLSEGAGRISRMKLGQEINVQSSLPYMKRLDDGHSPQNRSFWAQAYGNGKLVAENS